MICKRIKPSAVVCALLIVVAAAFNASAQRIPETQLITQLPQPGRAHAPANSPVARHGQLSVVGNQIRDENGNPVTLRGMSFFWSNTADGEPWYSDHIVGWLAHDWKATVVRAAMGVDSTRNAGGTGNFGGGGNPGWVVNRRQWNDIAKTVVDAAIRRGMYVIIDWHSYRAHHYRDAAVEFFTMVAEQYGQYPNIIYEIYNEPCTGSGGSCDGGDWNAVVPYSNAVINAIRNVDTHNIIVIGNPGWSSNPNQPNSPPITNLTNTVWAMHFYAHTHKHTSDHMTRMVNATTMTPARAVLATEFGHCDASGSSPVDLHSTRGWISAMEQRHIGWVNWSVGNKPCRQVGATWNGTACSGGLREAASIFSPNVSAGQVGTWRDNNLPALNDASDGGAAFIRDTMRVLNRGYYTAASNTNTNVVITYDINANASPAGGGSVVRSAAGPYTFNTMVTLTAQPADGWVFTHWSNGAQGDVSELSARITGAPISATANFWDTQGSIISNGHFSVNIMHPAPNNNAAWAQNGGATLTSVNGELRVHNIQTPGTAFSDVRINQDQVNLQAASRYRLSFRARSNAAERIIVPRLSPRTALTDIRFEQGIRLNQTMQDFTMEFDIADATVARLRFDIGGSAAEVFLDDVRLVRLGDATGAPQACAGASCVPVSTAPPTCPTGQFWNSATSACEDLPPECPPGQVSEGGQCRPECLPDQTWDGTECKTSIQHLVPGSGQFRSVLRGRTLSFEGVRGSRVDVSVFDLTGRARMSQSVSATGGSARLTLDRLPAGVYSVRVRVDGRDIGRNERLVLR